MAGKLGHRMVGDGKCVCDICICGEHACAPPTPRGPRVEPTDYGTTGSLDYVAQPFCKAEPFRPTEKAMQSGPFDGTTNYSGDYVPRKAEAPAWKVGSGARARSGGRGGTFSALLLW